MGEKKNMCFRNSAKLLFSLFNTAYKVVLYRIVMFVIIGTLSYLTMSPCVIDFLKSGEVRSFFDAVRDFIGAFFTEDNYSYHYDRMQDALSSIGKLLKNNVGKLSLTIVLAVFYTALAYFLNGIANYTVGQTYNCYMTSCSKLPFTSNLIRKLGKAIKYQLIVILFKLPFTMILIALALAGFIFLTQAIGPIALMLTMVLIIMGFAFESTVFCCFLPTYVVEEGKVFSCFFRSVKLSFKKFWRIFSNFITCAVVCITLNVAIGVCTLGAGLILTIPLSLMIMTGISFTNYYSLTDKKYYLDYDSIVVPKNLREEEKILEKIDI